MKSYENTKKKSSLLLSFLLMLGILACATVILGSLYYLYRPFTAEDVLTQANSIKNDLSEQAVSISRKAAAKIREIQAAAAKAAEEKEKKRMEEMARLAEKNTAPRIESSGQMGKLTDLDYADPQTLSTTYVVMLDTSCGSMLYYHQGDNRWGDFLYGGSDRMSKYGCGPTAVSMLINTFSDTPVTPVDMAKWSYENGYFAAQSGSFHSLIPDSLAAFGLQVESVTDRSYENVTELLSSGYILVALMGRGTLTANGHFVLFTKLLDNGNIYIADPANYVNCTQEWDLNLLLPELKKSYDSGGPLWAVKP